LGFDKATIAAKPRLKFAVSDVSRTANDLRRHGFSLNSAGPCASITDPDGAVIEFMRVDQEER